MKRFCFFTVLMVFIFVPGSLSAVANGDSDVTVAQSDAGGISPTLDICNAWVIADTDLLLNIIASIYGPDVIPEDILPLPWQKYMDNPKDTRWFGATLSDGKESYNMIVFWTDELSDADKEELCLEISMYPLGQLLFGASEIDLMVLGDEGGWLAFPKNIEQSLNQGTLDQVHFKWAELNSLYHIGMYTDNTKFPTNGDESNKTDGSRFETISCGLRIEQADDGMARLSVMFSSTAAEDSKLARAREARVNDTIPFRLGGFSNDKAPFSFVHRILPEDKGLQTYFVHGGSYVISPEERKDEERSRQYL